MSEKLTTIDIGKAAVIKKIAPGVVKDLKDGTIDGSDQEAQQIKDSDIDYFNKLVKFRNDVFSSFDDQEKTIFKDLGSIDADDSFVKNIKMSKGLAEAMPDKIWEAVDNKELYELGKKEKEEIKNHIKELLRGIREIEEQFGIQENSK